MIGGGVTLSQRRLDFGQAGPNVLTHISALANELEPYVEPYLGKEMDLAQLIKDLEKQMKDAAHNLEFEKAALIRDQIVDLRKVIAEDIVKIDKST